MKGRNRVPHLATAGERNGAAKITNQERDEIIRRYRAGGTRQQDLADAYGIDQSRVSQIIREAGS